MRFKNNTKQRYNSIQGLRSFKDTLPKNIKRIIKKKGHIYSETLNNWKYIVGDKIFKISYPRSFKNSNNLPYVEEVFTINRSRFDISQNIKKSFDPKRILNPGKMYTGI